MTKSCLTELAPHECDTSGSPTAKRKENVPSFSRRLGRLKEIETKVRSVRLRATAFRSVFGCRDGNQFGCFADASKTIRETEPLRPEMLSA